MACHLNEAHANVIVCHESSILYVSKTQTAQGIEVVADIKFSQVLALVSFLEKTYEIKERTICDAIEQRGSFPLLHHVTLQQIEVTLSVYRAYSQVRQERAQRLVLEQGSRVFYVASPE